MANTRVVSRESWGARPPRKPHVPLDLERVRGVAIHCIGSTAGRIPGDQRMRNMQNFHMDTVTRWKGQWSDIAYCLAVDRDGTAYLGQGLATAGFAEGRSKSGGRVKRRHNGEWISIICLVGADEPAYPAMITGLTDMVRVVGADLRAQNVKHSGRLKVRGHREIYFRSRPGDLKACPGDPIMAHILNLNHIINVNTTPIKPVIESIDPHDTRPVAPITPPKVPVERAGNRSGPSNHPDSGPHTQLNPPSKYAVDYGAAIAAGITNGARPNEPATRREAATMAIRAARHAQQNPK